MTWIFQYLCFENFVFHGWMNFQIFWEKKTVEFAQRKEDFGRKMWAVVVSDKLWQLEFVGHITSSNKRIYKRGTEI